MAICLSRNKSIIQSWTEAIREELKETGISVTALLPGPTESPNRSSCICNLTFQNLKTASIVYNDHRKICDFLINQVYYTIGQLTVLISLKGIVTENVVLSFMMLSTVIEPP